MGHLNSHRIEMSDAKWVANVTYKSDNGRSGVTYSFNHPEELGDLIEAAQERGRIVEVEIFLIEESPRN